MRKLASVQRVNGIFPIEGKDRIVQYGINGWKVIDQKDKYKVGDRVVYLEVDSWVPHTVASFLTKPGKAPGEYNGILGQKLRTIKMGGALSQGLLLPLEQAIEAFIGSEQDDGQEMIEVFFEGADVSELLHITKWEAPEQFRAANAAGNFPHFIRKTDQERVQNCFNKIPKDEIFEETEKLEGQSFTAFLHDGDFGICSRNLQLKMDEPSTWRDTALKYDLEAKLRALGANIAIQGEQVGPGIEGNIYGLTEVKLFIFDIFDIDEQQYVNPLVRRMMLDKMGIPGVPVRDLAVYSANFASCDQLLNDATVRSDLAPVLAEGVVYKSYNSGFTFKAVSNEYLLNDKKATPWPTALV